MTPERWRIAGRGAVYTCEARGPAMEHLPDDILVRRVLAGDQEAFRPLVERYDRTVHAAIYIVLVGRAMPEEMAELSGDAFEAAYRGLRGLQRRERFGPWIYRIARRKAIDFTRRGRQQVDHVSSDHMEAETGLALADARPTGQDTWERDSDRRRIVEAALASLPEELRVPAVLRYMRGLAVRTISEILGIPIRTVERRVSHARERLRAYFEARGLTNEVKALQRCALPIAAGGDVVARTMAAVQEAGPHQRSEIGIKTAGALSLVVTAQHGAVQPRRGEEELLVSLVPPAATSVPRPPGLARPAGVRAFVETGDTLGTWRPVAPTLDGAPPVADGDLLWGRDTGFHVANEEGVYLDTGRLYGTVTLDALVDIPTFGGAHASIGLVIDGQHRGVVNPSGGKQLRVDVARHRDGMWAHVNPDWPAFASPNYDGWARDRSQAWGGIAEASARPTHVRLVHRTDLGAYDIYIDGVLSASSVRTPATRGLPVTGAAFASCAREIPAPMRVLGLELWVDGPDLAPRRPDYVVRDPVMTDPAAVATRVQQRVANGDLREAKDLLLMLRMLRGPRDAVERAEELVLALERRHEAAVPAIEARLARLRTAAADIAPSDTPLAPVPAATRYLRWVWRNSDVQWAHFDVDWEGQGHPRVLVALPRGDYVDGIHRFVFTSLLAESYRRLTGQNGALTVSLRAPADLQHEALANNWHGDRPEGGRPVRDGVDALLTVVEDAVAFGALAGALPKAEQLASRHDGGEQAEAARRLVAPFRRTWDRDLAAADVWCRGIARGLDDLRSGYPSPHGSLNGWLTACVPDASVREGADGEAYVTLPSPMHYSTARLMRLSRDLAEVSALLDGGRRATDVFLCVPNQPQHVVGFARPPAPRDGQTTTDDLAVAAVGR